MTACLSVPRATLVPLEVCFSLSQKLCQKSENGAFPGKPRICQGNSPRAFADNLDCLTRQSLLDKGKPGETQGRKAKGLRTQHSLCMAASPPKVRQHEYIRKKSGPILERDRTFCVSAPLFFVPTASPPPRL